MFNNFMNVDNFTELVFGKKKPQKNGPIVESSNDYKIVIILDESGSMKCIKNDMIKSINDLINEQQTIDKPCKFTLVKFNENVNRIIENVNIKEVSLLSESSYNPSGTTALYDAIGDTIDHFRYEKDLLIVIVTDGQENSSKIYKKTEVKNILDEKQKNRGWNYVYLANDLSVSKQGDDLGCRQSNLSSNCQVEQDKYGYFVREDLCQAITKCRSEGISVQTTLNSKYGK